MKQEFIALMKDEARNQTIQVSQTISTPNFTPMMKVTISKMSIEGNTRVDF